jgi:hypothetical protein
MNNRQLPPYEVIRYLPDSRGFEATRLTGFHQGVEVQGEGEDEVVVIDERQETETILIGEDTLRDFGIDPATLSPGDNVHINVIENTDGNGETMAIEVVSASPSDFIPE